MATINRLYSTEMQNDENATNLIILEFQINQHQLKCILYRFSKAQNKSSSEIYFENLYNDYDIDCTAIYMLSCLVTYNTYMQFFKYKILKNVLFLIKKLHTFRIKPSPLCSFCNLCDETPYDIFHECDRVKFLQSDLLKFFQNNLSLYQF